MSRLRLYLLQSAYNWIVDHDLTPYVMIDAEQDDVEVPWEYVDNGRIVLNILPSAVEDLAFGEYLSFYASFSGKVWHIYAPLSAVIAVYAKETNEGIYASENPFGMIVNEGDTQEMLDPAPEKPKKASHPTQKSVREKAKKAGLRIIK